MGRIKRSELKESFITAPREADSGQQCMPKFKTTAEALKIVHNKDQIRNLGIIAHVDARVIARAA